MADEAESTTTTATVTEEKQVTDAKETTPAETKTETKTETKSAETTEDKSTIVTKPPESAKEETKEKPPEKYDLKLPEGSLLDESAIERTAEYAKTQGLSNDAAQELLERHSQDVTSHVEKQTEMWKGQVETDKEIGGDQMKESVEMARRVVARFGTETFKKELNKSGFGNHPEVVRIFARIGNSMGEDKLVLPGAQASNEPKSVEQIMYGTKEEK